MTDDITGIGCYPIISAGNLAASKDFYQRLAGLVPVWENDWFVLLQAPNRPEVQLAFIRPDHESIPAAFRSQRPAGVVVTIEVPDAAQAFEHATRHGFAMVQQLRDEAFGQRHFMVADPDGLAVDVVQQIFIADPTTV